MTYAVPSGFCAARNRAVAIAQVKMCCSSTGMPIRCSLVATSRRVRWLLLVRNRKGMCQSRSNPMNSTAPGINWLLR